MTVASVHDSPPDLCPVLSISSVGIECTLFRLIGVIDYLFLPKVANHFPMCMNDVGIDFDGVVW